MNDYDVEQEFLVRIYEKVAFVLYAFCLNAEAGKGLKESSRGNDSRNSGTSSDQVSIIRI